MPTSSRTGDFCQLGVQGGYCYLNASLIRLFGERAPGLSWQTMDEQFFGAQPGIPPYEEVDGDVRPDLSEKIGATFGWVFAQQSLSDLTELTDGPSAHQGTAREPPRRVRRSASSSCGSASWRWCRCTARCSRSTCSRPTWPRCPWASSAPSPLRSGRPDLIMPIIAGIGEVDSAEPSHAMWALSRLPLGSAEFDAAFADFLFEYGSRGPNEWETRSPSWETRPALALAAIDRMRVSPDSADPSGHQAERAVERERASAELLAIVEGDPDTYGQLAAAIGCSKAWLPGRERTKTNNIRVVHEMRMAMREIGRRMVDAGVFDEIEDFGFITKDEMPAFLAAPQPFAATVRQRRAEYMRLEQLEPPFVFVGRTDGPDTWPRRDAASANTLAAGDVLAGMSGCPGQAEGIARVVLDSNDPFALQPGDILIAPITDPSWTPLFVPAAGVVVDVGAPLSHAIIVSRELGIPCVISATGATRRIPNGARVRVDGSTGVVTVLELP